MANIRNQPCRCGSGKKYKHCHLLDDERIAEQRRRARGVTAIDGLGMMLHRLIAEDPRAYDHARKQPAAEVRRPFWESIGSGLTGAPAALALQNQLDALEERMHAILASRPAELWLILSRRLPPEPINGCTEWTVALYRRTLTLAILKHGDRACDVEFQVTKSPLGTGFLPKGADEAALLETASLESLAYDYAMTAAAARRVGKGATLKAKPDGWFDTPTSPELQRLISSVDSRTETRGSPGGTHGAIADVHAPIGASHEMPFTIMAVTPNLFKKDASLLEKMIGLKLPGPTAFVPQLLSLADTRVVTSRFSDAFRVAYGVDPDVALATLWSLSWQLFEFTRTVPLIARQALVTGYHVISLDGMDAFLESMAHSYATWHSLATQRILTPEDALRESRAGVHALTSSDSDIGATSLWDRLPVKCLIPFAGRLYIDYASMADVLDGFLRAVGSVVGADANAKALAYEDETVRRGTEAGLRPWLSQRELVANDGTQREIDASFIVAGKLWVLECKAYSQDVRIDRGDFAKLKGRREKLTADLDQARTLAQFLRDNRQGRNYAVPEDVSVIDYCVVTSAVEWIWGLEPELWLTDEVPRICTIDELLTFLRL